MSSNLKIRPQRVAWPAAIGGPVAAVFIAGCQLLASPEAAFDPSVAAAIESRTLRPEAPQEMAGVTVVRARVNGQEFGWFGLDSGAEAIILDSRYARKLGLETVGQANIQPPCRSVVKLHRATLQVGRLRLDNALIASLDLSVLDIPADLELAGVIGWPVFEAAVIAIDYAQDGGDDRVSIYDPSTYQLPRGRWQTLEVRNDEAVVHGQLATPSGPLAGRFMLDTGKALALSLYSGFIERHRLLEGRRVEEQGNRTICGVVPELEGQLPWFELAGHRFQQPTVRFKIPDTANDRTGGPIAGTVGREFLKAFEVIFHAGDARIAFLPPESLDR